MIGIIGVPAAHHIVNDRWIDLDAGDIRAAIGYGTKHVYPASRPDDGEIPMRPEHIGNGWRRRHEVLLPVESRLCGQTGLYRRGIRALLTVPQRWIDVHDGTGSIGIDDDVTSPVLPVNLDARNCIPPGELHPLGITEDALGINHVSPSAVK